MSAGIERIVVALDAASENRTAINTAARLAARWKAPMHGVFVEDDDLIRLANLPFARQVTLGLGVENFDVQQAERHMRAYAEHTRRDLAAAARRHGVEWTFEIVRGAPDQPLGAASANDFLVCSTTTRPVGGHFRVECRWWSGFEPNAGSFLLAHRDRHEGRVAALVFDQGPASERLLAAAARLAEANGGGLTVVSPPELAASAGFKPWLDRALAGQPVMVEVALAPAEAAALYRRIVALDCRVVALASGAPAAQSDRLRAMVAQIACDVLIVR